MNPDSNIDETSLKDAQLPLLGDLVSSSDPDLYIDRDFSWLYFNHRVMEEALDEQNPLLERVRFLSIFAGNLDEFYMVRIPAVNKCILEDTMTLGVDTHVYSEMQKIYAKLPVLLDNMESCWENILMPLLKKQNIFVLNYSELENFQIEYLHKYFKKKYFRS